MKIDILKGNLFILHQKMEVSHQSRAFLEFKVNFQGFLSPKSSCKQFSLMNIELKEQLLLKL